MFCYTPHQSPKRAGDYERMPKAAHQDAFRVRDIEHLHWRISEADEPISLSVNGAGFSLAAAVELALIDVHRRRAPDVTLPTIRAASCPIWRLLKASHWPIRRDRVKLRDGSIAVFVLPKEANDTWWTRCLHELLGELSANGFPANMARGLTGAVAEMADNVWQHSENPEPGLLAYIVRRRKLAFSVADLGIGVLTSLCENPRYKWLNSSMDAIQLAIRPGVSKNDGGGMGFPSLLNALADLWGNVRLRSGEARVLIDRTQLSRRVDYMYLPHLPGVHVSVRCAVDPPPQTTAPAAKD
jgi:hypothetical protein